MAANGPVDIQWILDLMNSIPTLLEYFVPGYCTIAFYQKLKGTGAKKKASEATQIIASIILSYVIVLLAEMILGLFKQPLINREYIQFVIEMVIGAIGAIFVLKLLQTDFVRRWFGKINNTSLSSTVFECCDLDKGPYITIYGENKAIFGRLLVYNEEEDDAWIALDLYSVLDKEKGIVDHWTWHKDYSRYLVPFSKVEAIEVHYDSKRPEAKWYEGKKNEKKFSSLLHKL